MPRNTKSCTVCKKLLTNVGCRIVEWLLLQSPALTARQAAFSLTRIIYFLPRFYQACSMIYFNANYSRHARFKYIFYFRCLVISLLPKYHLGFWKRWSLADLLIRMETFAARKLTNKTPHARPEFSIFLQLLVKCLSEYWMLAVGCKLPKNNSYTLKCTVRMHKGTLPRLIKEVQSLKSLLMYRLICTLFLTCYDGSDSCCYCTVRIVVLFIWNPSAVFTEAVRECVVQIDTVNIDVVLTSPRAHRYWRVRQWNHLR